MLRTNHKNLRISALNSSIEHIIGLLLRYDYMSRLIHTHDYYSSNEKDRINSQQKFVFKHKQHLQQYNNDIIKVLQFYFESDNRPMVRLHCRSQGLH